MISLWVYLIAMRLDWTKSLPTQLKLCPASLVRTEPLKMHFFTSFCSFLKFGKKENPHDIFGTKIPISRSKAPWQLYAVIWKDPRGHYLNSLGRPIKKNRKHLCWYRSEITGILESFCPPEPLNWDMFISRGRDSRGSSVFKKSLLGIHYNLRMYCWPIKRLRKSAEDSIKD